MSLLLLCCPLPADSLHRDLPRRSLTSTPPPTPPPDHESHKAESCELEKQARKHLSEDGCPPCYPADLGFPLRVIPDQYEEIISYRRSLPGTGPIGELHAQCSDWKSFRRYQEKIRRYHLHGQTFNIYLQEMRNRLRRHGLEEYSCLHSDRQQQSELKNWIEFQNYHLAIYESLEKDIRDDRENLDGARKQSKDTDVSETRVVEDIKIFESNLRYSERRLRQHKNLLRWIEQQRIAMAARQATSVHDNGSHVGDQSQIRKAESRAIRRSSSSNRQKDQKASALSPMPSRVTKKIPQKQILRPRKRDVPSVAKNTTMASSTHLQEKKSRRAKKITPLRPFRPQRVSKTAENARASKRKRAVANAKSCSKGQFKRRKSIEQPLSVIIKCSGRVSWRPERFCSAR